jgi:hypothetical protein
MKNIRKIRDSWGGQWGVETKGDPPDVFVTWKRGEGGGTVTLLNHSSAHHHVSQQHPSGRKRQQQPPNFLKSAESPNAICGATLK